MAEGKEGVKAEDLRKAIADVISGGASAYRKIKEIQPNRFTLAFILALANYLYSWSIGFEINLITILIDALTYLTFIYAGLNAALLLIPLILETVAPAYLIANGIIWGGYLVIIPLWVLYSIISKFRFDIESPVVNWTIGIGAVISLILLVPSSLTAITTPNYVINQKWIQDTLQPISKKVLELPTTLSSEWQITLCTFDGTPRQTCRKKVLGIEEELIQNLKFDPSLETGFKMEIADFIAEGESILTNEIPTQIAAQNNLQTPLTLTFACGLEGRAAGTPEPQSRELKGFLPQQESNVLCTKLDISKKGTPIFYFNITATNIATSGFRDVHVIGKEYKNAVLLQYPGISENRVLELSKEFGSYIKEIKNKKGFVAKVGKEDLVQPILWVGSGASLRTEQPSLIGLDQSTTTDVAIFLKNNGKGTITNVRSVKVSVASPLKLDNEDCGLTQDVLKKINWQSIAREKIQRIASCKLQATGPLENPNNPQAKTITINLLYDYTVSKKVQVNIPEPVIP